MRVGLAVALAVATGTAFSGAAVAEETTWDGFASLGAGNTWYSAPSFAGSNWLAQARGTAEFSLGSNWGSQLDIVGTDQSISPPSNSNYTALDLAAHVFYRAPGQWLVGPIAQYRSGTLAYASGFSNSSTQYYLGGEAQAYMGKFSLYGQAAYQGAGYGFETATGWAVRGRARFFVNPEWFIEATALHSVLASSNNFFSSTENTFGAGTEYHVSGTPLGVFANYSYSTVSFASGFGSYNVSRVLAGIKWSFGGHSLWERETGGASLDPFPPAYSPPNPPI